MDMRQLAQSQNRWSDLRLKTLERLAQDGEYTMLTEIYLEEGEIDQAIASLEQTKKSYRYWSGFSLEERVAQAANEQRPRESIRLYVGIAESLINSRGRGNYQQAAGYLRIARDTYQRLGEPQAWQTLIDSLREQHRNLPALQDELDRARL